MWALGKGKMCWLSSKPRGVWRGGERREGGVLGQVREAGEAQLAELPVSNSIPQAVMSSVHQLWSEADPSRPTGAGDISPRVGGNVSLAPY